MKIGDDVTFTKHIAKNRYGADKDTTKEFAELYGLSYTESEMYIYGYTLHETKWRGFIQKKPVAGIICGKRNIGGKVSYIRDEGAFVEKYVPVYLVANKLSGFYYVPVPWIEDGEGE